MSVYKLILVLAVAAVPLLIASLCYIDYMFRGVRSMNFVLKFILGLLNRLLSSIRILIFSKDSTSTTNIVRRVRLRKSKAKTKTVKKRGKNLSRNKNERTKGKSREI